MGNTGNKFGEIMKKIIGSLVLLTSLTALAQPLSPVDGFETTNHSKRDLKRFWNKVQNIESYNKNLKAIEGSYLDVVIRSEGAFSYQDIMTMPVDAIKLLVERMNARVEDINKARKGPKR